MPRQRSLASTLPLLVLSLLFAACGSPDATTPTSLMRTESVRSIATSPGTVLSTAPRTADDEMMDVATEAPGFAGLLIEKGTLITMVSSRANRDSVGASVHRWRESRGVALPSESA